MNRILDPPGHRSPSEPSQHKSLRILAEFLVVAICTLAFAFTVIGICALLLTGNAAAERDFVSYWAAGQQLAHHQNPYDGEAILPIERSAGFDPTSQVLIMRNPPSALLLALPLGFFSLKAGALLWSLLLLACLVLSVRMLWTMHGRPNNRRHLLGYSFGPALACLLMGQTSLFALLGLVLFLRLHRTQPFMAGISLWLCALKPHLFLPFGVVLLVWIVITRSYPVLIGAALALTASTLIALRFDRSAWLHYRDMLHTSGIDREFIPCLSVALRLALSPQRMWLQYAPVALACVWAIRYLSKRRDCWDWMRHGSLLMLVSILVAPYAWFTDQAILVPAILEGVYLSRSRNLLALLALASAVIEIEILFRASFHSTLYIWTAPAWLAWYLVAARAGHPEAVYHPPPLADRSHSPADPA